MTQFANKRFSVSQSGRSPEDCGDDHWLDKRGKCVFCGEQVITFKTYSATVDAKHLALILPLGRFEPLQQDGSPLPPTAPPSPPESSE